MEKEQETRALLRKKFLKSILYAKDKEVVFNLHENTAVLGTFKSCDYDPLQILVADLQTPSGTLNEALLRTSDIISYTVDLPKDNAT
ncbi:gem-associated protein 7-like [Ciona intestinalis]